MHTKPIVFFIIHCPRPVGRPALAFPATSTQRFLETFVSQETLKVLISTISLKFVHIILLYISSNCCERLTWDELLTVNWLPMRPLYTFYGPCHQHRSGCFWQVEKHFVRTQSAVARYCMYKHDLNTNYQSHLHVINHRKKSIASKTLA